MELLQSFTKSSIYSGVCFGYFAAYYYRQNYHTLKHDQQCDISYNYVVYGTYF